MAKLRCNFLSSMVVFLVALPLCLGIAVASGVSPEKGLISGAIGGVLVGALGGSVVQVSGPANGLIVVVAEAVGDVGLAGLGLAVFIAGALQLAAGALGFGQFFRAVSPAVILGLMAGFAIVIASGQIYIALGSAPVGSALSNLSALPEHLLQLVANFDKAAVQSVVIALATMATILIWKRWAPRRLAAVPAYLVAILLASAGAALFAGETARVDLPGNILGSMIPDTATIWSQWREHALSLPILELAATIAFIASAETLLSATALDKMHSGPRTRYNRELTAQGLGNMLCGLLGALPVTGVIIRGTANVAAGATSRLSAVLHGVWLLGLVLLTPGFLEYVPLAALAAVLIHAVIKLIDVKAIAALRAHDAMGPATFALTALGVITLGVAWGVGIGVLLSLATLLARFSRVEITLRLPESDEPQKLVELTIAGPATFLRLPYLASMLEQVPPGCRVRIVGEQVAHVDHACRELILSWIANHERTGGKVEIDRRSPLGRALWRAKRIDRLAPRLGSLRPRRLFGPS